MNCEKALELFSDHFEGRLNQGLREAVERHLTACPSCQVEYEQFVSVVGSIAYPEPPLPPIDLGDRIARRLDKVDWERRSKRPSPLRFLLPVAAAGVVVLGIVLFNQPMNRQIVRSGIGTDPGAVLREPFFGTRVLEGGKRLSVFGTEGVSYTILEGGTDFSVLPPRDAVVVERGKFEATGGKPRRIDVKSPAGAFIWIRYDFHEDILLVIAPSSSASDIAETPATDLITAMKAFADRHQVSVFVRLGRTAAARRVPSVPLTGDVLVDAKSFADAVGFDHWSSFGAVIQFH